MKRLLLPFLFIAFVAIYSSCQKEFLPGNTIAPVTPPDTTVLPPVIRDSTALLTYIEIDSIGTSQYDTTVIIHFTYDAQKRLITMNTLYSTDSLANLLHYQRISFSYHGADTLPSKSIKEEKWITSPGDGTFSKDTINFTYDAMGRASGDSTMHDDTYYNSGLNNYYYTTHQYYYGAGFCNAFYNELVPWDTSVITNINHWLDSNIITSVNENIYTLRRTHYTLPSYSVGETLNFNFSYDNHPNPFSEIPALPAAYPVFPYGRGPLYVLGKNNATSITQQARYNYGFEENLLYEYNSKGYPVKFYSNHLEHIGSSLTTVRNYKAIFAYGTR